jgi:type IV secretion system protein VirD4
MEDLKGWAVLLFIVFMFWAAATSRNRPREIKKRRQEASEQLASPVTYDNPNSASSARWASDKLMKAAGLFKGEGWRIGYSQSGKVLRYGGPGHLLIVAGARKGKMVSVLAPAMLDRCDASRIVIDPKGEICAVTHKRAGQFSKAVAIDPFGTLRANGVRGVKVVGFNPLASLDPKSMSFGGDVASLAEAIVWDEGTGIDRHFTDSARQLVAAVIRVVVKHGRGKDRNLLTVRDAICGNVFEFARKWVNCGDSAVRQSLARYAAKGAEESRELNGVISTAVVQTDFLAMEGISGSLADDGLNFADLKRKRMTVYVVLPLDKLASCGKWFRLVVAAAIGDLLKAGPRGNRVLCIVDEFFSIGPLKAFQTAMSQAAGAAGLQLWPVLQDLAQLQTMYPNQGWRTFMSNTAVKMFFGDSGDKDTAEYISAMCGQREMITLSTTVREDRSRDYGKELYDVDMTHNSAVGWQKLVQPHEVGRMNDGQMIVFCERVPGPILAKRKPYFEGWEFRGQYGSNPYYGGGSWLKGIFG